MDYKFSDKISSLKPSAIREILKATSDPGIIPLAAGNPAPDAFPVEDVRRLAAQVMQEQPIEALQYGVSEGYEPLREVIRSRIKQSKNIGSDADDLIILSGASQVMDLAAKVLCNEGDTIICENPSFIGSLNCFRSHGCRLAGVPVEADGMDIDALEKVLASMQRVKFIYTIPNFQNPSGATMSLDKRRRLYDLALKYNVMILEDDPYGDLRVSGKEVATIKSMDSRGIVIYAGSFSKILAPGLRVAYAVGPRQVLAKMTVGKQTADVHNPILNQMIVYRWLRDCDVDAHINKIRGIYRGKLELMCSCLDSETGGFFEYNRPEGGLFLWCRLPDYADMNEFVMKALEKKVAVVPGSAFLTDENEPCNYIRLNYSTPSDDGIVKGIKLLGDTAREIGG